MAGALEVINNDDKVQSIFINIFGGITQGEEVANGIVERPRAGSTSTRRSSSASTAPTPTRAAQILEPAPVRQAPVQPTMLDAARAGRRAGAEVRTYVMAIFVDENTKVIYQGLTGRQGRFYGLRNRDYGTQVVGRRQPQEGRHRRRRHPRLRLGGRGGRRRRAPPPSCIFIPRARRAGRRARGGRGRHRVRRVHHRGRPRPGRGLVLQQAQARLPGRPAARPQLPGHHQPRQVQHRHHRRRDRQGAGAGRADGRHRQPVRHADLPGALRAQAQRHRRVDLRRHRRRPRARDVVHRLPRARSRPIPRPRPS